MKDLICSFNTFNGFAETRCLIVRLIVVLYITLLDCVNIYFKLFYTS
jgi:hypothetical protein